ncbi:MAG: hypothetical protein FWC85_02295 [Elusimicrobia bacterium]|nr:hypothetical protein [Elusimicrobiota bacterium]
MKKVYLIFTCAVLFFAGCAKTNVYVEHAPPRQDYQNVQIFRARPPDRPFKEIAEIRTVNENVRGLRRRAARLGGDGVVIITSPRRMHGDGIVVHERGSAVVIKFTD